MKVAINLRLYVKSRIGGLENYIRQIVPAIAREHTVTAFVHKDQMANVAGFVPDANLIAVTHENAPGIIEPELAAGYDVLFCPLLVLDPLAPKLPSAVMMPDLQHEFFPDFFDANTLHWRRQTYRPSTIHASRIFTLSAHAKQSIVDKLRADPDRVEVVHLDAGPEFRCPPSSQAIAGFALLGLPTEYLLYPANFWPHKNHATLLEAFKLIRPRFPNLGLVFTGVGEGADRVRDQARRLGLDPCVFFPGYVDASVLVEIYRHARALTFISRYEGFGIPILEAFHAGIPVICSQSTSCPEVAGHAALTVDEHSPQQIARAIERVLSDRACRQDLIERGRRRTVKFSWQRAIDQTLAALAEIAERRPVIEVKDYPLVTIVTPSLNKGRFIKETVDSVLSQDYPLVEYLVMDGGSTDDTLQILQSYNGRLRFICEPDKGQADAVNKGFGMARGRIFTFLNADDTYLPGAVGIAVEHMLRNPTMGVVYGEANYVQEDGTLIGRYPTMQFDREALNRCCFICQPAAFMWSDAFITAGYMNPAMHFALDYDLWMRIAKHYQMLKVDETLATSRMYRENKTLGQRRRVYMEILSAARVHYGYVPFEWVFGYSSYLMDRKDQFFEASQPSLSKILLSLGLGTYYNRREAPRYWKDWALHLGLTGRFEGRYPDGWISRRYRTRLAVSNSARSIRVEGRHLAPFPEGLHLCLRAQGRTLAEHHVKDHGVFSLECECPAELRGTTPEIVVQAHRTFRPIAGKDYRKVSCLIDALSAVDEE